MSLFQDTKELYSADWQSSPWRNYHRPPKLTTIKNVLNIGHDLTVSFTEEDMVGGIVNFSYNSMTGAPGDYLSQVKFTPPNGTIYSSSHDVYYPGTGNYVEGGLGGGIVGQNLYTWVLPGVGFQWQENHHQVNTITSPGAHNMLITEEHLNPRMYDGGMHCWIKLNSSGIGEANSNFTKTFPNEWISLKDTLVVYNSLGHIPQYPTVSNRDVELVLQGSVDNSTFYDLTVLMNGVDPVADLVGNGYSYVTTLEGSTFPEYRYFRLKLFTNSGSSEPTPQDYNFYHISIYPIERH